MTKDRDDNPYAWDDNVPEQDLPETIRLAAQDYHRPPQTPREGMWAHIEAARSSRTLNVEANPEIIPLRVRRRKRVTVWATGIAAVLIVGIGLGRLSTGGGAEQAGPTLDAVPLATPSTALRVATGQHLARTETFLTMLRTDPSGAESFTDEARELLVSTRLMIDSRATDEPKLRALLLDLELILVQIVQLDESRRQEELDLITDGLEQHQVLPRIRTAIPAGPIAT